MKNLYLILLLLLINCTLTANETYIVEEKEHDVFFENSGRVEAIKRAKISAEAKGIVTYLGANVSEHFKKGDVLVKLSSIYQNAKVKETKHDLENARLDLKEKKREYDRVQHLNLKHLARKAEVTAKRTAYNQAKKAISKKKEKLSQLKELASYSRIVAPFDGVVEKRHVRRSEKISVGQELYSIYSQGTIRVVVTVPESMLKKIKKYQKIYVESDEESYQIDFDKIVVFPSSYNYTYTLRLILPKELSSLFHDGNFVKVKFKIGKEKAVYVHNKYLHKKYETTIAYLQTSKGIQKQYVRLGERYGDEVKILSGLVNGDNVVKYEYK